jgi:hypothetical protein
MLSSISQPKTKHELVRSISNLPTNTKFSVIEVLGSQDKIKVNKSLEQLLRKGSVSVILIEDQ